MKTNMISLKDRIAVIISMQLSIGIHIIIFRSKFSYGINFVVAMLFDNNLTLGGPWVQRTIFIQKFFYRNDPTKTEILIFIKQLLK